MQAISQRGKNTLELGIYSYKKDTLLIKASANEDANTTHTIPSNTNLFIAPKKIDMFQNAVFPLPKDNNFIATHLGIITNFDRFMSEEEFVDFLSNSTISIKISDKDLEPLEVFHYYIPQRNSSLPKFGQFTAIPVPIEFDDISSYVITLRTYPNAKLKGITTANKATQFGSGVIDNEDTPTAWLKVVLLGKLDRV
jgi:hypothetical protein